MNLTSLIILRILLDLGPAHLIEQDNAACASYTLLETRGTLEPQGDSPGFEIMNLAILATIPGGKIYNTIYPADVLQDSEPGTQDIINHINITLASNPSECFILQGYSQGATATVEALDSLADTSFDAVKGVFLIGNPEHRAGYSCNVDNYGGNSTFNVDGIESLFTKGIPSDWLNKTLDVCILGDGVCDTTNALGANAAHVSYQDDPWTQVLGFTFAVTHLGWTLSPS